MAQYQQLTLDDVYNAFELLDPNMPFQEWAQIGRSLYSEFDDAGLDAFKQWSELGSSYKESEFQAWRKNFKQVTRTTIGSFIRAAINAGWKPARKEFTKEERAAFALERQKRIEESEKKRKLAEQAQWQALKTEQQLFHDLPKIRKQAHIGNYLAGKMLHMAYQFNDLRRWENEKVTVKDTGYTFYTSSTVRALWSDLGNKGKFCGFEKLADKKGKKSGNQKFASADAMTEIGFTSIGYTEQTTRVFVGGGYANCLVGHMVTKECWISPVGEGHIPTIIHKLRKQYPNIQFIAAPDNDKQGLASAKEAQGPWTVPAMAGADWWDVWRNEGNQALAAQLANIRGFELVISNSRYLHAPIKPGLNLLESDMGTGKSYSVKNYIKANLQAKTLIISHRKALAQSLKTSMTKDEKGIDVQYYEDLIVKGSSDQGQFLRQADCLVISVDSLYKLVGSQWDTVFVDEAEQNLAHYFAETNTYAEQNLNMLHFLLTHSKTQILADAHLGELTKNFCAQIGLNSGVHYHNEFKIGTGKTINIFESKNHLSEFVKQQLIQGQKSYIFANSKRAVKNLAIQLEQERERGHFDGEILVVHADLKDDPKVKAALKDIEAAVPNLDIIIASPTLGTGFDIPSHAHKFTSTIGFLNSTVGSAEEGHQGLNRARDVQEFNVYIDPAQRSEPTDADFIYNKLIDERSTETIRFLNIDPQTGDFASRNPLFEWLYCEVKAQINLSKNDYKGRFIELAEKSGYTINFIEKDEIGAKMGREAHKVANERTDRIALREIQAAKCLTGDDLEAMNNNSEAYSSEEITKSRCAYDLNLFDASNDELDDLYDFAKEIYSEYLQPGENYHFNEQDDAPLQIPATDLELIINALTFKQSKSRFVNSLKRLSLVALSPDTVKTLDRREVNQADKSRANWRHQSIKRAHLLKILKAVGLDEQLNYSGKEWSETTIKAKLVNWLKKPKTQDELFKYSGVTVTEKTKEKPVQWINNFLRSAGLPVKALGKRRVKGKATNVYGLDEQALAAVRTLVLLRARGIEQHMAEREENSSRVSHTLLMQEVTEFINNINDGMFDERHQSRFSRLMEQVSVLRNPEIVREHLQRAFAKIAHHFSDNSPVDNLLASDPSLPTVISNPIPQGGSPTIPANPSNHAALSWNREEAKIQKAAPDSAQNWNKENAVELTESVIAAVTDKLALNSSFVGELTSRYQQILRSTPKRTFIDWCLTLRDLYLGDFSANLSKDDVYNLMQLG